MTTVTLLHPGSMGSTIGAAAVRNGHRVRWVTTGRSPRTRARAAAAGLEPRDTLGEALFGSDIVLSICPAHAAEDTAKSVAEQGYEGVFVEANPITPELVRRISSRMPARCSVLDGSIFGPSSGSSRSARIYLAGDSGTVALVDSLFAGTDVEVRTVGSDPGTASALKLAFTSYQRSARVLAAISHALAARHGVSDLLAEEARGMSSNILSAPEYLPSVAARAWRWAPEMDQIAEALRSAELPDGLAELTGEIFHRWDTEQDQNPSVERVLALLAGTEDS
ncbi:MULTISPECIES: NAD(P)-dependent oxidoreductase [Streptomyces]|uniref:NAD(P)-dependent oxidoreductase n=1 Tax=Streptomyces tsukubensis (strain DSM 42081 / NBRC 108919 / NRRL 18488 / 9993) TaxID=1114943 RepID=I2N6L5_STRT9|nr:MULTISPECIES: NAD(P)-dependent oxidoreductase [Streptomyces]AZK96598.1 phosphogluconate dehydrogenase [Streptomyces tsukubensis]EIF92662.1 phosphogluconate dehydrogenase, NAD-binding -like protein [Streptomyces tsukubensis NRRL18488]MYS67868.1 DUF1932 domain-containing protein [Streptomyces sp. SID5473]QKM67399.1 NAD(P)-dependent oxidoreductase [Streptomyces tsukubensis NRRL18488]TAI42103.1 NAD(P)-dependent oxidoreductase [Streptomyces tsukubensis]